MFVEDGEGSLRLLDSDKFLCSLEGQLVSYAPYRRYLGWPDGAGEDLP